MFTTIFLFLDFAFYFLDEVVSVLLDCRILWLNLNETGHGNILTSWRFPQSFWNFMHIWIFLTQNGGQICWTSVQRHQFTLKLSSLLPLNKSNLMEVSCCRQRRFLSCILRNYSITFWFFQRLASGKFILRVLENLCVVGQIPNFLHFLFNHIYLLGLLYSLWSTYS